jgi:hypothetical protein
MHITTPSVNPVDESTLSVFEIDGSLLYLFTTDVNYYLIVGNYYQSSVSSTQDLSVQCRIIKLMFFVCPYIHFRVPDKRAPSTSGHWCLLCIPAMDLLYFMFIWLTHLWISMFCIVNKDNRCCCFGGGEFGNEVSSKKIHRKCLLKMTVTILLSFHLTLPAIPKVDLIR